MLTHWGWVKHICVIKLTIIGPDNGLSPGRRQSIISKQCWNIVDLNLRNKLQWNLKRNAYIFIQENAFKNVVCEMPVICLGLNVLNQSPITYLAYSSTCMELRRLASSLDFSIFEKGSLEGLGGGALRAVVLFDFLRRRGRDSGIVTKYSVCPLNTVYYMWAWS